MIFFMSSATFSMVPKQDNTVIYKPYKSVNVKVINIKNQTY